MIPPRPSKSSKRPPSRAVRKPPPKKKKKIKPYKPYKMRLMEVFWLVPLALIIGFGGVIGFFSGQEIRKSTFQADYFSHMARMIAFAPEAGADPAFWTPSVGPYNQRLGYSYLPFFIKSLESEGYEVASQARVSPLYRELVREGFYPIYHPKTEAGLTLGIRGAPGLHTARFPSRVFRSFESLPPLLVDTLLFIENRELLKEGEPTRNPVIEWKRLTMAAGGQLFQQIVPKINLGGGSTLATQIEKFRFSPDGQTRDSLDKFRQIISGSLRVYLDGPDTREKRKRIVLDYFNSTPLSARAGFGEVNGLGDGLWAWFGREIEDVRAALDLTEKEPESLKKKGAAYRETLALFLAQRRPSHYLLSDRAALEKLVDATLDNLAAAKVITPFLRVAAKEARLHFLPAVPPFPAADFLDQKAVTALRVHLLSLLGLRNFYELDRVDMDAQSTIDAAAQRATTAFLAKMKDPAFLNEIGFYGDYLLTRDNDPSAIRWSVLLYEKTQKGNELRVQADNINGPMDMNEGAKLDLGSTAKLRTLVTYLEVISEAYGRYTGLDPKELHQVVQTAPDALTLWTADWLAAHPKATLEEALNAAMDRTYSASPNEVFFTGGGEMTFVNFSKDSDGTAMNLRVALRDSVNLVFIRLMRDIVNYEIGQNQSLKKKILNNPDSSERQAYLERYADDEGKVYLGRFLKNYEGLSGEEILEKATQRARKSLAARTILFRTLWPQKEFEAYAAYMKHAVHGALSEERLLQAFEEYAPEKHSLADQGYIVGLHPLELWLAAYKIAHPEADHKEIFSVSGPVRLQSYAWLLSSDKKKAQDSRIRILLEKDAFKHIRKRWARLGYPFERLVPSLATAIGSSADRPAALVELLGILVNDGVRRPLRRMEIIRFAQDTPFETTMRPRASDGERVLPVALARVVRAAMTGVVESGTARRVRGVYVDENGGPLVVGAKTGTGDHRYEEYGPGNRLISSRVVNRTGTIVFFISDKLFGVVTAHVAGSRAAEYKFTSALPAQALKAMAESFQPLLTPGGVIRKEEPKEAAPMTPEAPDASVPAGPEPEPDASSSEEEAKAKTKRQLMKKETFMEKEGSMSAPTTNEMLMDILP